MSQRFITNVGGRPVGWFESLDDDESPMKTVLGTPGDDKLHGGKGDDSIDGLAGADTMAGRLGNDVYVVDNAGDVVKERAGEGTDTVVADVDWTLGQNVENLTLRGHFGLEDLRATGNALDNVIVGNAGENWLDGAGGNDLIKSGGTVGPFESDTLVGGKGNDTLLGGAGYLANDLLQGGDGNDLLQVGSGASVLDGGDGNDHLVGGSGDGQHFPSFDTLVGGAGKDTLEGGSHLDGGDGNDLMTCSLGISVAGGTGNDTIDGTGGAGYSNFYVDAGTGDDLVDVAALNNSLTLYGGEGNDALTGSAMISLMIDAGIGDDTVSASIFTNGTAKVFGGDGADSLSCWGGHGAATLDGGSGDDQLFGGGGSGATIALLGGEGNDTLGASQGLDTLTGGGGDDLFLVRAREVLGDSMFFFTDFASGADQLGVSQSALAVGNGDLNVDGAVTTHSPGGFDASAELVIVAADIFGDLTLDKAAAAIGSANQSYAAGQTVVFMVDNGVDSWALYFQSNGTDAQVSAGELSLLAHLNGTASTAVADIVWTA